jgi:hypothetical protein
MNGPIFTATFSAIAVSAAQDVFELITGATSRIEICEVFLGQYSDVGDAAAEMLSVQIVRGHTVVGSGGAAVTPANLEPGAGRLPQPSTGTTPPSHQVARLWSCTLRHSTFKVAGFTSH